MAHQKRLSAPKHYDIDRKGLTYTTTTEGSRSPEQGIPAVIFLREVTGYADTKKEAKKIIRDGQLHRNGDRVTGIRDTIGIMDVIEISETGETYRMLPSSETLIFEETSDDRVAAKVTGKTVEGDEYVYHLHNGENYRTSEEYSTGSTLIFNGDAEEHEMSEGEEAVILGGQHAGKTAEIKELHSRGMKDDAATVETSDAEFEIRQDKLFVKGDLEVSQ